MNTLSYTAARADLAHTMQRVCSDHAPVIITRAKAEPVVMLSLADFESLQETYYLFNNPINASRLAESINEIEEMIARDEKNA